MAHIFMHSRIISFILIFIFTIFLAFSFMVIPADASVAIIAGGAILVAASILLTGGITFASLQDMQLSVGDFLFRNPNLEGLCASASITGAWVQNGIVELGSEWLEGWGYFWESAKDYFGVQGAIAPYPTLQVERTEDYMELFVSTNNLPVYPYVGTDNSKYSPSQTKEILSFKSVPFLPFSNITNYPWDVEHEVLLNCFTEKTTISFANDINISLGFAISASGILDLYVSFDNFKTLFRNQFYPGNYRDSGMNFGVAIEYIAGGNIILRGIESYREYSRVWLSPLPIFDSSLYPSFAGQFGGTVMPNWDIPADSIPCDIPIEKGNQALKDGKSIDLDAGFMKELLAGLIASGVIAGGLGVLWPDIPIDWTQSAMTKDTVLDTDKPMPSPSPVPSASPSAKPSPAPSVKPDFPINKLPVGVTSKFPFSLPWDIYYLIKKMQAEPVAPKFIIPINLPSVQYYDEWVFDLSEFDEVTNVVRWGLTLLFVLGLVLLTRKLVK